MTFPARTAVALLAAAALTAGSSGSAVPSKPDDKTILHVLNRMGYGARPGDVDRVRQLGLAAYIDQQLHPERIPDTGMTARLAGFDTLNKSSRQLADEYFVPALQARKQAKKEAGKEPAMADKPDAASEGKPARTPEEMEAARKSREVIVELTEQKILRAAYSDRQLEEVMTDFWFNHFNVFAGKGATQRLPHRVRARRDPAARLRQVPRSARRDGAQPGDALLSRQLAERGSGRAADAAAGSRRRRLLPAVPARTRGSARASRCPRPTARRRIPTRRSRSVGSTRTTAAS